MPSKKRHKTKYAGVYYIESVKTQSGKPERIFYIYYRIDGRQIEEKAGRQYQDDMTPARAAGIRAQRIQGKELNNDERREVARAKKEAQAGRWTIDKLWVEYKSQRPLTKTIYVDGNRYENYLKPVFGDKEPRQLIQLDIDRLRIKLLKKLKPQTVKHILGVLKRTVNFGVNKGLCEGLGFAIQMPRVNNKTTEDLTQEQLKKLLKAIDADPNQEVASMMKMALFTGMRRGELFKLQWQSVDFERGFITIRDPKGGQEQKIPINDNARAVLESVTKTRSPYVFPSPKGGKRSNVRVPVNRIKKAAGIPDSFRALHGLRHVYASMLASSGKVDMYTLQKLLTHKSPQMTQRYAHLRDESLRKASDLAGELVSQAIETKEPDKVVNLTDRK